MAERDLANVIQLIYLEIRKLPWITHVILMESQGFLKIKKNEEEGDQNYTS